MEGQDVLVEPCKNESGLYQITLNRPSRLNALSRSTVARLNHIMDDLSGNPHCRAVIMTGAGRSFCSGQDLQASNERNVAGASGVIEKLHWQEQFAGMGARIRSMPQIVIAAVNGPAVGAGMAIALAADVRIATPAARFLVAAVRIGLTGGESGISYLLPRMIGASRAFDILLTGRPIDADEAERIGLVRSISEPDRLLDDAIGYARSVLANSPYSVAQTKKLMWSNLDAGSFEAAVEVENRAQILGTMTEDYREATAAFIQKRAPRYQGK